ncbi:lantibiotic dehydratase [Frankia sp. R82]|uniref:lantibiotic dehydratase n=1 Tax=Frankia sp. R82 TaxID=2950553 RepID=UPI0020439000|nr:lantibiotic dehydratase [Frankia sp. R82]MCM3886832.1 lantibiotic dehydratase [Frankia sp. R82]
MRVRGDGCGFRPVEGALLRASVGIDPGAVPGWPDSSGGDGEAAWRAWIGQVWMIHGVAGAVSAASPVLADRVAAVQAGEVGEIARVRRVAVSLAGYVVRLQGRATPFGLFAGIAPLRFGDRTVGAGSGPNVGHQVAVRADAAWVEAVVAQLEPGLFDRLLVTANDLAEVRSGRLVIPGSAPAIGLPTETAPTAPSWPTVPPGRAGSPGRAMSQGQAVSLGQAMPLGRTVSLRFTAPVRCALQATRRPVAVNVLVDQVAARFPQAHDGAVRDLVKSLVQAGALITCLRPPLTAFDGLGHLMAQLTALDAAGTPAAGPMVSELADIQAALAIQPHPGTDGPSSPALAARMRALAGTGDTPPVAVDLRLGDAITLPAAVATEATAAAGALVRLTPHPYGPPTMKQYHRRFLERFGPGAVVPVTRLVSLVGGLGYPRHGLDGARGLQARPGSRDEQLVTLAQQAALDGVREVLLDDQLIGRLASATGDPVERRTDGSERAPVSPPHLDLCVEVLATSVAALDRGDFRLAVCGIGQSAIATSGRFLSLLPRADRARFVEACASLPVGVAGALPAQVSFAPLRARARNVFAVPPVLPIVLSLGEHRDRGAADLDLQDLAVTADPNRVYVVSLSRRCVVEPMLVCAAARHAVPTLAMFLVDVARAASATIGLFDWGAAAGLPFLPRLRYGRAVLAPARWRVPRGALPGADAPLSAWLAATAELRDRLRLPERICVGVGDRQLRLRLDDPMHVELLRNHLRRPARAGRKAQPALTLTEAPSEGESGWCQGRAHEVLIPLASTAAPAPAPRVLARPGPLRLVNPDDDVLPGAGMLFAKVFGDPDGFTTLLTEHLPRLLADWDIAAHCWFVRYHDPTPHLRIRLRTADYGQAAARTGAWVTGLRRHGLADTLTLDTYQPEPARYGHGAALAAAERFFAADSAAALAELITVGAADEAHLQAQTAASLVDLAGAILGGRAAGVAWLVARRGDAGSGPVNRMARRRALHLAAAYAHLDGPAASTPSAATPARATIAATTTTATVSLGTATTTATSPAVAAAWQARRDAADAYTSLLRVRQADVTPAAVVRSLLHLQHNRRHGPGADTEDHVWRLARAIALAETAGAPR